jgi:hypothetical protein
MAETGAMASMAGKSIVLAPGVCMTLIAVKQKGGRRVKEERRGLTALGGSLFF